MAQGTRRFRLETLEQKKMLAGDVLASIADGLLLIEGDELSNEIAITSGEQPGSYVIQGLDGTRISLDGAADSTEADPGVVVVQGVTRGIRANMGDGDDRVVVNNLRTRGNIAIRTGSGDDTVRVGELREEPVAVREGTPEAEAEAQGPAVEIGRSLRIHTGDGDDSVLVQDVAGRGRLHVATGGGDDTVRIGRRAQEPAPDNGGENPTDEVLAEVAADAGARPDTDFRAGVRVRLGNGDDTASVSNTSTRQRLAVGGGAGDDTIRLSGVHARSILVRGGQGNGADTVDIRDSATRVLFAALGGGDDVLNLGGVRARLALLSGGPGEADALNEIAENSIRHQRVVGFELPAADAMDDDQQEPASGDLL